MDEEEPTRFDETDTHPYSNNDVKNEAVDSEPEPHHNDNSDNSDDTDYIDKKD